MSPPDCFLSCHLVPRTHLRCDPALSPPPLPLCTKLSLCPASPSSQWPLGDPSSFLTPWGLRVQWGSPVRVRLELWPRALPSPSTSHMRSFPGPRSVACSAHAPPTLLPGCACARRLTASLASASRPFTRCSLCLGTSVSRRPPRSLLSFVRYWRQCHLVSEGPPDPPG